MNILKQILKGIAVAAAIILSPIVALFIYMSFDHEYSYWAKDARFKGHPTPEEMAAFQSEAYATNKIIGWENTGRMLHALEPGRGLILSYRLYTDPMVFAIDDEGFESLTIWIDTTEYPIAREYDLDSSEVQVLYTSGGTAWPDRNTTARVRDGTLEIRKHGSEYRVNIRGKLDYVMIDFCRWAGCEEEESAFEKQLEFEPAPTSFMNRQIGYSHP